MKNMQIPGLIITLTLGFSWSAGQCTQNSTPLHEEDINKRVEYAFRVMSCTPATDRAFNFEQSLKNAYSDAGFFAFLSNKTPAEPSAVINQATFYILLYKALQHEASKQDSENYFLISNNEEPLTDDALAVAKNRFVAAQKFAAQKFAALCTTNNDKIPMFKYVLFKHGIDAQAILRDQNDASPLIPHLTPGILDKACYHSTNPKVVGLTLGAVLGIFTAYKLFRKKKRSKKQDIDTSTPPAETLDKNRTPAFPVNNTPDASPENRPVSA